MKSNPILKGKVKALIMGAFFFLIPIYVMALDLGTIFTYLDSYLEPTNLVTFYQQDIEASNCSDLPEFLENKGFLVMNTGGTGSMSNLSIGGYAGFCIKVYVDGILANNPTTGEFDWNSIDLNSIQSISINYSPEPGQLEFAGATINITTKLTSGEKLKMSYETKSYENSLFDTNIWKLSYNNTLSDWAYKLDSTIQTASNNYEDRHLKTNSGNEDRLGNVGLFISRYVGDCSLSGEFRCAYNQYACDSVDIIDGIGVEKDLNLKSACKLFYSSQHYYTFSYQSVQVDYNDTYNKVSVFEIDQHDVFIDRLVLNTFLKDENSLTFNHNRLQLGMTPGYCYNNDWIGCSINLGNLFYTDWDNVSYQFIPSGSVNTSIGFTYSIFRSFVLPTYNQLYWNGAGFHENPNLKPEYGYGQVLSFKKDRIPINASVSQSIYRNKIRWTGHDKFGSYAENVGDGYYWTWSLGSSWKWEHFSYDCSVSYNHATLDSYDGNQIMWVPRWQSHLGMALNFGCLDCSIDGNFFGKRPISNQNINFYEPYFLLSVDISIRPSDKIQFTLKGDNLLDERYLYHDNYSAPSRSISLLVNVNY